MSSIAIFTTNPILAYSALIFFFGAEFTHAWATRHHSVAPKPHATPGAAPQTKSDAGTASLRTPPRHSRGAQ